MTRWCFAMIALGVIATATVAAPPPRETLESAEDVLEELQDIKHKGIPPALISDAQAVVIVPRVVKAGFLIGGRGGHGVALCKEADGTWGEPTFVNLGGASFGFQAGVQSSDVVLVIKSKKSLERILEGKGKLTLGADASVAAGPVGRQVEAGTDARLKAEIVSYSRSRGLFAGVALDGAAIMNDKNSNYDYLRDHKKEDVVKALAQLKNRLVEMGSDKAPPEPSTIKPIDK